MNAYVYSSPAVSAGALYIGCFNGRLYSFDETTGNEKWVFNTDANTSDPLHVLDRDGGLSANWDDTSDSTMFESMNRLYSVGSIVSSPLVDSGVVYFGSADGNIYAITDAKKVTSVHTDHAKMLDFHLSQNYPNPFNPTTMIGYQLPASGVVTVTVYDVLGHEIGTVVDEVQTRGDHQLQLSMNSLRLQSGVYFYRLRCGSFVETKRMMVLK